jgi:hypothetical protein
MSHLRLEIDAALISHDERDQAAAALRHALGMLENRTEK